MQSGSFPVRNSDFKQDPDWTAAIAAYEWISKLKITLLPVMISELIR